MNHLLKIFIFLILTIPVACTEQTDDTETQEQESETYVYTHYSDTTELFVEFSALIVGQTSSFAAHFSKMSDFLPVEKGAREICAAIRSLSSRQCASTQRRWNEPSSQDLCER